MPQAATVSKTKLIGVGVVAGAVSGLFGVGGGSTIVPLLILWFGFSEKFATGTSLVAIVLIALVAAAAHGVFGDVDVGRGLLLGVPAIAGVIVGAARQQKLSDDAISFMFVVLLLGVAALLIADV